MKETVTYLSVSYTESVASVLERDLDATIALWLGFVENKRELTCIQLTAQERTAYLPKLIAELIVRLRLPYEAKTDPSVCACQHGELRRTQGYTVPMLVEESRLLEVSIFSMLQRGRLAADVGRLLLDIITIADEVDSQLKRAMLCYTEADPPRSAA